MQRDSMTSTSLPATTDHRPREWLLSTLVVGLVVLACFRGLVENPSHLLVGHHRGGENDLTSYFLRALDWPRSKLADGTFPGWNSHFLLGSPTWGNPQSLLFYPPNWLCLAFGSAAVSWLMVAHHLWVGLGAVCWARQLGVRSGSAMIAGAVAAAAPYAVAHTAEGHYPQTCVMAWIPWILWAFERFLASYGKKWLAVSVCLSMGFFAGHLQEIFYLVLLTSGTLLIKVVVNHFAAQASPALVPTDASHFRLFGVWLLIGAATFGCVLVDLLPTFANSRLSVRAGGLPLVMAGEGLTSQHVPLLWDPQAMQRFVKAGNGGNGPWETCFHFGMLPAMLTLLALLTGYRRRPTWRLYWMLAVTVLFAFGMRTPFFRVCYSWLPGVASFRSPARILYLSSMLVSVLAAIGWDALWDRWWNDSASCRRRFAVLSFLLVGCITWELSRFTERAVSTVPWSSLRQSSSVSEFLKSHASADRVLSGLGLYDDREAQHDHLQKLLGYDPFLFQRYAHFFEALARDGINADPAGFQPPKILDFHQSLLDLAGVRYAVMPGSQQEIPGWKRVHSGTIPRAIAQPGETRREWPFVILENQSVMPRAFVIGQVSTPTNADRGETLPQQLRRIDPRQSALLFRDHWPVEATRCEFAEASIESYSDDEVRLRARCNGNGYLVLTDLFHPGWHATVDGHPATVVPANIAFRAVPLTPGEHEVVFRFTVPGGRFGAVVSAISWLGVLGFAVATWRHPPLELLTSREGRTRI
jgi:hypothetical protein